jgi:hypothetical protein
MDRQAKPLHIVVKILDNFSERHESVRVIAFVLCAGHPYLEGRRHQGERVPALIAPRMGHRRRSLQYDMFASFLSQMVADRESRLTTSYDDRIDCLQHGDLINSELQLAKEFFTHRDSVWQGGNRRPSSNSDWR